MFKHLLLYEVWLIFQTKVLTERLALGNLICRNFAYPQIVASFPVWSDLAEPDHKE